MARRERRILWTFLWIGAAALYLAAALAQKHRLNLSSTAGGQFPYLEYAAGMAVEGVTGHWGDRNRMPVYPALIRPAYHPDWPTFADRASYLAIGITFAALVGLGAVLHRLLSPLPAAAATLFCAFGVFLPTASFVQADLLYYALFFAAWALMCRVLRRPDPRWGAAAGAVTGLAWLTKASALPALMAYLIVAVVQAVTLRVHPKDPSPVPLPRRGRGTPRRILVTAAVTLAAFLLVVYPYIANSKARFGRYFYNVNSTFFVWCDSWAKAQAFMEQYRATEHFPNAPPDALPSPANYWKTHSLGYTAWRLGYGVRVLAALLWWSDYGKPLAVMVATAILAAMAARRRGQAPRTPPAWVAFNLILFAGYTLAYAWYVVVAYGDRFIGSLAIPAACTALWVVDRGRRSDEATGRWSDEGGVDQGLGIGRRRPGLVGVGLGVIMAAVVVQAGVTVTSRALRPSPVFVRFYYIESYEQVRAGNDAEAVRGFQGVIRLDPAFASAHRELGAAHLRAGRFEEAAVALSRAVELAPEVADAHNSLGTALAQLGRLDEAIRSFQRAAALDGESIGAWYNLAVLHHRAGDRAAFEKALASLRRLDPPLAQQLEDMVTQP